MTRVEFLRNRMDWYLADAKARGVSTRTLENYEARLRYFSDFFQENCKTKTFRKREQSVTKEEIIAYRDYLLKKGLKPLSVKQYLQELQFFFNAMDEDYPYNPVTKKLFPKVDAEKVHPYEPILNCQQMAALINNKHYEKDPTAFRIYCLVNFIMSTGLRNSEVRDLKIKDIDFENAEIIVRNGKGNKYRIVDLDPYCKTLLKKYLKICRPHPQHGEDYVFYSRFNKRLSISGLSKIIEKWVRNITHVPKIRSHDLRHICAIIDLNSGMGIEALQSKLGHASVITTQVYSGRLLPRRFRANFSQVTQARQNAF